MTTTEFNRHLKELSNKKGLLDPQKIKVADTELKTKLVEKIVRHRHAVIIDLVGESQLSWLASMGYLYKKQGKNFLFLCTCENMKEVTK